MFQLGVVIRQLPLILLLGILLLPVQLVDLLHQGIAAALVGIQRQPVQRGDGLAQRADLLLVCLPGRTGRVAGTIAAGQGSGLRRRVGTGVLGILGVQLGVLAVQWVGTIAVTEFLPVQQILHQAVNAALIGALVIAGAVGLPLLQVAGRVRHLLRGPVLCRSQRVFHILPVFQPACGVLLLLFLAHVSSFPKLPESLLRSSSEKFSVSRLQSTYCNCSCIWYR